MLLLQNSAANDTITDYKFIKIIDARSFTEILVRLPIWSVWIASISISIMISYLDLQVILWMAFTHSFTVPNRSEFCV